MIGIDSDCIIDFLRGSGAAINVVDKFRGELATTEINRFEVFFGISLQKTFPQAEANAAHALFKAIPVFPFGQGERAAAILAALMKDGSAINQNDTLIAAALLANGCSGIITKNRKDFAKIKGLEIISY